MNEKPPSHPGFMFNGVSSSSIMCFNKVLLDERPASLVLSQLSLLYVQANLKNGRFEEGHYIYSIKQSS